MQNISPKIVFLGTSRFAVIVLQTLFDLGIKPSLIITTPDSPVGRKLILTPSPVKIWANEKNIEVICPQKLSDPETIKTLENHKDDIFVTASYGKILPKKVLDIPSTGMINIHPSLLPLLRGSSPLQSAILNEEKTGVTIMKIDEEIDHGPIIAQKEVPVTPWPIHIETLEEILAKEGAILLEKILKDWKNGKIKVTEQEHSKATFTDKIKKEDGEISLEDNPLKNYRKYLAFGKWPGVFFFSLRNGKNTRIRITEAVYSDNIFTPTKVVPEGKKEMSWDDFLRGSK